MYDCNLIYATYNGNYSNSIRTKSCLTLNNIKCVLENIDLKLYKQITVVIAEETEPKYINKYYDDYLKSLQDTEQIKIVRKKNDKFLSYSSYYEGYKLYPNFKYYMFFEDDYLPLPKYIDITTKYMESEKLDYLFGVINKSHRIVHACHALLICKGQILKTVFHKYYRCMKRTKLPHQMAFYRQFDVSNFKGDDLLKLEYSMPFYVTKKNEIIYYNNEGKEPLVMPIQYYYNKKLSYPNGKLFNHYLLYPLDKEVTL